MLTTVRVADADQLPIDLDDEIFAGIDEDYFALPFQMSVNQNGNCD